MKCAPMFNGICFSFIIGRNYWGSKILTFVANDERAARNSKTLERIRPEFRAKFPAEMLADRVVWSDRVCFWFDFGESVQLIVLYYISILYKFANSIRVCFSNVGLLCSDIVRKHFKMHLIKQPPIGNILNSSKELKKMK